MKEISRWCFQCSLWINGGNPPVGTSTGYNIFTKYLFVQCSRYCSWCRSYWVVLFASKTYNDACVVRLKSRQLANEHLTSWQGFKNFYGWYFTFVAKRRAKNEQESYLGGFWTQTKLGMLYWKYHHCSTHFQYWTVYNKYLLIALHSQSGCRISELHEDGV